MKKIVILGDGYTTQTGEELRSLKDTTVDWVKGDAIAKKVKEADEVRTGKVKITLHDNEEVYITGDFWFDCSPADFDKVQAEKARLSQ